MFVDRHKPPYKVAGTVLLLLGRPGCWQKVTKDLYPFPYLLMDTGYSIAPHNHAEIAQPMLIDYVWGRQVGEHTINP